MPAHRKRPDQRQDNSAPRALVVVPPAENRDLLPARRDWRKATKDAWAAYWESELANAAEPADTHAIYRLFDMRDRQQRAFERYEKQPYLDGSKGQPVANPAFAEAMTLERAVLALEDRLGLSPKARAQLGIAFGQAALTAADLNRMALEASSAGTDDVLEVEGWEEVN